LSDEAGKEIPLFGEKQLLEESVIKKVWPVRFFQKERDIYLTETRDKGEQDVPTIGLSLYV